MTITELNTQLAEKIQAETGQNVFLCYQCVKCTSGCPLASYFDLAPNQVMRAAQLGFDDTVLKAKTMWLCASCQTCTTRCPQGIDIARVMDFLAHEAQERGIEPAVPQATLFNKVFLRNVSILGRAYELGLMAEMNLRTGQPLKDMGMGLQMIAKRKIKLTPTYTRKTRRVKRVARTAAQIGYYPGCSLHSTASEYDHSIRAVASALGLELVEMEGWLCCGSSPAHRADPEMATELPLRNLALVEEMGFNEVVAPCAMCFNRLKVAQHEIDHDPALKADFERRIGHTFQDDLAVRSLLDVLVNRVGVEAIAAKVERPLAGLKVACYYGCLLTRPAAITGAEDAEYPMAMDRVLKALGAEVVDWGGKTTCCGASLSITRTDIVLELGAHLLDMARAAGADALAVACPLCHLNLDGRQAQILALGDGRAAVPVLYLSQWLALALGLGEKAAALSKNMVDPKPLLQAKGLLGD